MSKKESKHRVEIEICSNCKSHSWCTRHDQKRYEGIFEEISKAVAARDPDIEVVKKLAGDKKMGAFQVTCNGKVLFSKLTFGYFPLTKSVTDTIVAFVEDNRNGKDVAAYDIGHEKYRRVESMARSGISMKSKSKSPSPKRQENFRPYRKEQLGIKMVESKVQTTHKTIEKEQSSKHKTDESVNEHQNKKQTVKQENERNETKKPQQQKKMKEKSSKVIKEPQTVALAKEEVKVDEAKKEQKMKTAPKDEEKTKEQPKKEELKKQELKKEEPKKEQTKKEHPTKQQPKAQHHPKVEKSWQVTRQEQQFHLQQK